MKAGNFFLIFSFSILIRLMANPNEEFSSQLGKKNIARRYPEKNKLVIFRKLEEYDTYITLSFKEDCTYQTGFGNIFRNGINYIKNTQNDEKFYSGDTLTIIKDTEFEIHFNESVTNLNYFFSSSDDENMIYLNSVDFSNFDSS